MGRGLSKVRGYIRDLRALRASTNQGLTGGPPPDRTGRIRAVSGRWQAWSGQSPNRRIFAAIITVGSITLFVKFIMMAKELVIANRFGVGDELDAYNIAYLLPVFVANLVSGSFNASLIPTYIQVRDRQSKEAANRLLSNFMVSNLVLLGSVSLLLVLTYPFLVHFLASGFSPAKIAKTSALFTLLVPIILFNGFSVTFTAILNAGERFGLPSLIPGTSPIIILLALMIGGPASGTRAIAVGAILGVALEVTMLALLLRRQGIPIRLRWYGMDGPTRQVAKQYVSSVAGAMLTNSSLIVDQSIATRLGSGSVAALAYGGRLTGLIMSVGGLAVSTSIMPYFSAMTARDDWKQVRNTLTTYVRLAILAGIPIVLLLIFASNELVHLLYERGKFTSADTELVSRVQVAYALQVAFFIPGIIGVRLLGAMKCMRTLMWISAVNLIVNISADLLLMRVMGVAGIALSTSLVYAVSVSLVFVAVSIQLRRVEAAHLHRQSNPAPDRAQ